MAANRNIQAEKKAFAMLFESKKKLSSMSNNELARLMRCSESKLIYGVSKGSWKWDDLRKIFKILCYSDDEILKVMKM